MDFGSIYDFVFYGILKYDYSSSALTGELQHDVVFGLLIPTVFILIVLHFSVRNVFGVGHAMIGNLAAITALGVIITLGWVPIIAGLGSFVFVAILAVLFIGAFYRRLVPEGAEMKLRRGASWAGGLVDVSSPVMTPKQERTLATRFETYGNDYENAVQAVENLKNINTSINMRNDPSNTGNVANPEVSNLNTEIARHSAMMNHAIESAVTLVESVPKNKRFVFIKRYAKKHKKFKEKILQLFKDQESLENTD